MKLAARILIAIAGLLVIAVASLAFVVSHDSSCVAAAPHTAQGSVMKAIVYRCYGGPEVMSLEDVEKPTPADDEVLVRVKAASVNPLDWHFLRGEPYLMRMSSGIGKPKDTRLGVDFSGTVEAVGKHVQRYKPGDEVFGGGDGALAQYVVIKEGRSLALKPSNISFEQAAAVPIAAVTALQALRDKGHLQPGQKVLVNGASGGVGTYAVQIAKAAGAKVTGVCSTRNVALVRSLGAAHVVDYTKDDFTRGTERFDIIIDNVGSHPLLDYRRVLTPKGIVVIVGSTSRDPWLGPLSRPLTAWFISPFVSQTYAMLMAQMSAKDLGVLRNMLAAGQLTPVIDRTYPLAEAADAVAYLEKGRARGKVVVAVE